MWEQAEHRWPAGRQYSGGLSRPWRHWPGGSLVAGAPRGWTRLRLRRWTRSFTTWKFTGPVGDAGPTGSYVVQFCRGRWLDGWAVRGSGGGQWEARQPVRGDVLAAQHFTQRTQRLRFAERRLRVFPGAALAKTWVRPPAAAHLQTFSRQTVGLETFFPSSPSALSQHPKSPPNPSQWPPEASPSLPARHWPANWPLLASSSAPSSLPATWSALALSPPALPLPALPSSRSAVSRPLTSPAPRRTSMVREPIKNPHPASIG